MRRGVLSENEMICMCIVITFKVLVIQDMCRILIGSCSRAREETKRSWLRDIIVFILGAASCGYWDLRDEAWIGWINEKHQ